MDNNKKIIHCSICLEDIENDIEFLPCIHGFHRKCIDGWINENPLCPLCPICKVPLFLNTAEELSAYNEYKQHQDNIRDEESQFFQRVSSGQYDNANPLRVRLESVSNEHPNDIIINAFRFINRLHRIGYPEPVQDGQDEPVQDGQDIQVWQNNMDQNNLDNQFRLRQMVRRLNPQLIYEHMQFHNPPLLNLNEIALNENNQNNEIALNENIDDNFENIYDTEENDDEENNNNEDDNDDNNN